MKKLKEDYLYAMVVNFSIHNNKDVVNVVVKWQLRLI